MKEILKKDIVMWITYFLLVILFSFVYVKYQSRNSEHENKITEIERKVKTEIKELKKNKSKWDYPYNSIFASNKGEKIANKIEIKNLKINKKYTEVKYTLKNNYEFEVFIMPEDQTILKGVDTLVYAYDFDSAYKVLKPGEEVNLTIMISSTISEKMRKKDFVMYKQVFKNENSDAKKEYLGYIELKEK